MMSTNIPQKEWGKNSIYTCLNLGINIAKNSRISFSLRHKTKKLKKNDSPHSWNIGVNDNSYITKTNLIYIQWNLNKIPKTLFTEVEKAILNFIKNHKRPRTAKAIVRRKNNVRSITILGFILYLRDTTINTICS